MIPSLSTFPRDLATSTLSASHLITIDFSMVQRGLWITEDAHFVPTTQEIPRILGALCQEPEWRIYVCVCVCIHTHFLLYYGVTIYVNQNKKTTPDWMPKQMWESSNLLRTSVKHCPLLTKFFNLEKSFSIKQMSMLTSSRFNIINFNWVFSFLISNTLNIYK